MSTSTFLQSSTETRVCRGECGRELPLDAEHFRQVKGGRPGGQRSLCWIGVCRDCERERSRVYYAEARDLVLAQQRIHKRDRTEYAREYLKRNRSKLNRQARERHQLRRARARAPIPLEVARPFLQDLLTRVFAPIALDRMHSPSPDGYMVGIGPMAQAAGVDPRLMKRLIVGGPENSTISQQVLDRLAKHGEFTVQEVVDRATEWALLTGDSWPRGYRGSGLPARKPTAKV